jgi:hypothetical protein
VQLSRSTKVIHAYLRDSTTRVGNAWPSLRVELRERPPGLMEIATVLSWFLCVTAWTVGAFHEYVFRSTGSGSAVTGSWPTILFGVPTLLVGWLFSKVDGASLGRVSLTSGAMMAWLGVNSAVAMLAAALKSSGATLTEHPRELLGFTIEHQYWALIMLSCAVHAGVCSMLAIIRAVRFSMALNGLTWKA